MQKEKINIKQSNALKGFLFRAYHASRFETTGVEDPEQQPLSNTIMNGFTLIELLVVVLIIGILAAIALPQYQKAVVKARFAEAITTLKTIKQAQDLCELREGEFCGDIASLDITLPGKVSTSEWESQNFRYINNDPWTGYRGPAAEYLKEDVCICYYDAADPYNGKNGKLVLSQNIGCNTRSASYEYDKLLGLTDVGDECGCC